MFHPNTQRFLDDWRLRRGDRRLPARADLEPAAFGRVAPQLLMLGVEADGRERFRLAGGFVVDLHGRELQGAAFADLWPVADRPGLDLDLRLARRQAHPVVLTAEAYEEGGLSVGLEIALAPVLGPTGRADRLFGLYQPTSMMARLRGRPVRRLALRASAPVGRAAGEPSLRLVAVDGRRVA